MAIERARGAVWRWIPPLSSDGATQMAIDRWLLAQHQQGWQPPSLRFYTWRPPAISLGYHQRRWPQHWHQLARTAGLEIVRRPTGGRAVLHQGDLTYAVVTSGLPPQRQQAYTALCQFLIAGWRSLGIPLHYGTAGRRYARDSHCFGTATGADLVTREGYKLIGSAQLRQGQALLQHGAMRLAPNPALAERLFGERDQPPPGLTLPSVEAAIAALAAAARDCFGIALATQPLTEREWQQIASYWEAPLARRSVRPD